MCSIPLQKKNNIFYQCSKQVLAVGGGGGAAAGRWCGVVSSGSSCITAPEYKARGQGWDAAGTGLCSSVEGICNGT